MAEERTLDDRVKAAMGDIGLLYSFSRDYPQLSRDGNYRALAQYKLAAENAVLEGRDPKKDPDAKRKLDDLREEWDTTPENLVIKLGQARSEKAKNLKDAYGRNKDLVQEEVEAILNASLAELDPSDPYAKAQAANILSIYLLETFKEDMDKERAQGILRADFTKTTGISYLTKPTTGRGSINDAQGSYARLKAADYIVEDKDKEGNVIGYKVDSEKLKKLIDNVESGSVLYSSVIATDKAIKEAAKKKKAA